jgi:hypothetical protein
LVLNLALLELNFSLGREWSKAGDLNWSDGLACNVVESLLTKYRPTDTISAVEYEQSLEDFKLKKGQDPTELFNHFVEVNTQYGVNKPDERKLIAIALKKLPEKYVMAFSTLNVANGGNVDLDAFEETVESIFCATN